MDTQELSGITGVSSLSSVDGLLVNAGSKVRQIQFSDFKKSLDILDEKSLMQVACYTDFMEDGNIILNQGGNTSVLDVILDNRFNCLMKADGHYAKLDMYDSNKFIDGQTATLDGTKGEEITRIPPHYYLVEALTGGGWRYWVSLKDIGGHYFPGCWIGTHKMYVAGAVGHSWSGYVPTASLTISAFYNAAQALGANFGLAGYWMYSAINKLFMSKYKTTKSEGGSILGVGLSGENSSFDNIKNIVTGKANKLGARTGFAPIEDAVGNTVGSTSVFGVKDLFGPFWEFAGGIVSDNATWYITDQNVAPVDAIPTWASMRTVPKLTSGSSSYITQMQWGEYGDMLAKAAVNGSSNTYYCDGYWASNTARVLLVGGHASSGALGGLSAAIANNVFSGAYASFGARLAFFGTGIEISPSKFLTL